MRAETDISTSKIVHPSVYNESDWNISLGDRFVATLACGISSKEAQRLVWKVLKHTSGGGDETWDAFYLWGIHQEGCTTMMVSTVGSGSGTSHPSRPKPLPLCSSTSAFSIPFPSNPGRTMAARQPSSCRPPAVSVPAPRIHAPPHPLPQSALCLPAHGENTGACGVRWKSEWSLIKVTTELILEMKWGSSLNGGEVLM